MKIYGYVNKTMEDGTIQAVAMTEEGDLLCHTIAKDIQQAIGLFDQYLKEQGAIDFIDPKEAPMHQGLCAAIQKAMIKQVVTDSIPQPEVHCEGSVSRNGKIVRD